MNTIFIGIAGGTGSGKTTLTEHLAARFGSDISVVHHDNYYKRQDRPFEERCQQNYDHPDAFDTDLMIADLKALKRGETIHCPVYDYAIHNRTAETVEVKPTKVVIVEGILIFQNKELRDLLDIKNFRGDGRRRPHPAPRPAGRGGAGPVAGVGGEPISHHGEAHARAVRGAHPQVRGHHRAGGRPQSGGAGHDHAAHRQPHCGELT